MGTMVYKFKKLRKGVVIFVPQENNEFKTVLTTEKGKTALKPESGGI